MSSISVRLEGDTEELLERLNDIAHIDKAGLMNAIAEGLRTSTVERFGEEESPEGRKWEASIRARSEGGKTLQDTNVLMNSIRSEADSTGASIGTNTVYAATHQFGDTRTIRAKNGKYLHFRIGERWVNVPAVTVEIPARPFLGVSEEDEKEIMELLEETFQEYL